MKKTRSNRQNWWCNQLMWIWVWELHNHGLVISSCEQFCIWVRRITLNRRKRTANGSGLFNAQTQRFQQHTIQSSSPRNILCVYKYMYTYVWRQNLVNTHAPNFMPFSGRVSDLVTEENAKGHRSRKFSGLRQQASPRRSLGLGSSGGKNT